MIRPAHSLLIPISILTAQLAGGCGTPPHTSTKVGVGTRAESEKGRVRFRDTATELGIRYQLGHGGKSPLSILETAPGGCAFADLDRDGWQDLILVGPPKCAVYRNVDGRRFEDITSRLGFEAAGPWMGCTVGDCNGDQYPDLLLTGYRRTVLLQNVRGQKLLDVTRSVGIKSSDWTTSAAFCDVDGDGWLDLYVGAYVDYRVGVRDHCRVGTMFSACGPEMYNAEVGRLYRNVGGARFQDITQRSGLNKAAGKTWGVSFADYDADGWPDLYLANDQMPGNLFRNLGHGRFAEIGMSSGTAYDARGSVQGGMGVDWGDYNRDGRLDLLVTTYTHQVKELYRNEGKGFFQPAGGEAGLAQTTLPYVAFGTGFFDADNDGWLDILIANGHIRDNAAKFDAAQQYAQPLQLLINRGDGTYADVSAQAGDPFQAPLVGRGVAFGDYDNDGRVDAVVMDLEGRTRLLHNEHEGKFGNWLTFKLDAGRGNTEGIGARVTVTVAGHKMVREVTRGKSVLSACDARAFFGLGNIKTAENVTVRWPDGAKEEWRNISTNRMYKITKGSGQLIALERY